jgi:hypothetical protein
MAHRPGDLAGHFRLTLLKFSQEEARSGPAPGSHRIGVLPREVKKTYTDPPGCR